METTQRLVHLVSHWIEHNESHIAQLEEWVARAREAGLASVADQIDAAAEAMKQANAALERARETLA